MLLLDEPILGLLLVLLVLGILTGARNVTYQQVHYHMLRRE